jgi:hypothetical protein
VTSNCQLKKKDLVVLYDEIKNRPLLTFELNDTNDIFDNFVMNNDNGANDEDDSNDKNNNIPVADV